MAYIQTDRERREQQEERDYKIWEKIIDDHFKRFRTRKQKQDDGCSHDARLTAYTKDEEVRYCFELKWQNNIDRYVRDYGGAFIKTDKYNYMQKDRKPDEREFILYICSDGRYYLFDSDAVIGNVPTKDLRTECISLNNSEYVMDGCSQRKEWTWCYILPIDRCISEGRWS